jgi:hypothetical protein
MAIWPQFWMLFTLFVFMSCGYWLMDNAPYTRKSLAWAGLLFVVGTAAAAPLAIIAAYALAYLRSM